MLEQINQWDINLFLFLNSFHNSFWDKWMAEMTEPKFWWWFFTGIVGLIIFFKKKESLWYLAPLILALVLSDQVASSLFKPFFCRLRPCYNLEISHLIHQPEGYGCGGRYGFFSSHAATAFGLVCYVFLTLKKELSWGNLFFLVWAIVYSYTRIYLGKHYPLDILCGAICGIIISYLLFYLIERHKKSRTN